MASKITSLSEIAILNNVDNLREVRSDTLNRSAVVRVDVQPYVNAEFAIAQITSVSQTILRRMPPGGPSLRSSSTVDNALVEIENTNRNPDAGLALREAILAAAETWQARLSANALPWAPALRSTGRRAARTG